MTKIRLNGEDIIEVENLQIQTNPPFFKPDEKVKKVKVRDNKRFINKLKNILLIEVYEDE